MSNAWQNCIGNLKIEDLLEMLCQFLQELYEVEDGHSACHSEVGCELKIGAREPSSQEKKKQKPQRQQNLEMPSARYAAIFLNF